MKNKGKATIHDIAEKLNITASTVSRALNNNPRISEATRKAVQKAAKQLNYQPNNIAAALRNGKSHIIGIIVPTADRSFFASVVRGIEEIAEKANYNVMICQSYDSYEKEKGTVEALLNARVDGIIVSLAKGTENFDHFMKVKEKGIPLILFDRTNDELEVSQILLDDYLGGYKIVEHLIQQGYTRIAHFTGKQRLSIYKERMRGYLDALKDNNIAFDPDLVIESNMQLEDGRESMQKLLALKNLPDAVFSSSDYSIMGAMQVLKERGISIPDEIALAGFGNEPFTSFTEPPITTVDQLSISMGNTTAEVFFEQIRAASASREFIPQKTVLKPKLIFRQSSMKDVKPVSGSASNTQTGKSKASTK
jgi:LacI family transcriptional regulator